MSNQVYILLGGNQGDVKETFIRARSLIGEQAGEIAAQSPLYQTEPWGFDADELFFNQVLLLKTPLAPEPLLDKLLEIESLLGRTRKGPGYASRIIDIDILFYNDCVMDSEHLTIPHPRMHLRNFALMPMDDLSPGFVHPLLKQTMTQLKDSSPDKHRVLVVSEKSTHQMSA